MAMMPHPRHWGREREHERERGGRVAALDPTPSPGAPRWFGGRPAHARPGAETGSEAPWSAPLEVLLAEFTARWERGEAPLLEEYLSRLGPAPAGDAVELIYHAYCLAESSGLGPDPAEYLGRFPDHASTLERLFGLHRALDTTQLRLWADPSTLPEPGDEIGPLLLRRVLGEGSFARVFLAEQSDLDHRHVVVKVSARITPEARLLARARHAHIVEVLWQSLIDDGTLQLICMPFLGGATLAAVLDEQARRGGRPRSGRDLLAALDRVSSPEYPATELDLARPARQVIARLSHPRALAWVVARLAEALDYAYGRGVLHGDVKPSNILLTADGTPMLLDFNLAVGWRSPVGDDLPGETGGTLAYMAPERLRALAGMHPEMDTATMTVSGTGSGRTGVPRAADRHRADLYSLGMVLLEALAGRAPDHPRGSPRAPRDLAAAFALSRQQGAETLIRSCRVAIEPGLRSIIGRCLAPDPADRYRRGAELAEDLDRWCSDRPLAFAREPHWRFGLLRWARRRRRGVAAAALALIVGAVSTLAAWNFGQAPLREKATAKLAHLWDDAASRAFRFQRFGQWRPKDPDAPEEAAQHLAYYNVLGPADWRLDDEFRALGEPERSELEIWLLEQALRFGRALRQRPDSPDDWRRGLEVLDRVVAQRPLGPLETEARLLRLKLGRAEPPAPASATAPGDIPSPRWMEDYLLGVEAEPLRAEDALAHYRNVLRERPESFWGHYRVAAVAHRLGDSAAAADHLEHCIARRPENPTLRGQLAGCLYDLHRYDAALEQCNKALELNPDHANSYRTRALIRGRLGQDEGLRSDIGRFELLTRHLGKVPALRFRLDWNLAQRPDGDGNGGAALALRGLTGSDADLPQRLLAADPEDVDLRAAIALQLIETGHPDDALAELDKALEIDPDHLRARYLRGGLLYEMRRDSAEADLAYLLDHPRLEELIRECDKAILAFYYESWMLLRRREVDKAVQVARRGLIHAQRYEKWQGELHYALARAYAYEARSKPERLVLAASHLRSALHDHPDLREPWFAHDIVFDGRRAEIDRLTRDDPNTR
jgi:serine/threonine protein kinase/Tfp pilus assembly protein PilF